MGYGNDSAGEFLQELLEPIHAFRVQVVGRFVEQQHVGLRQQQAAQRDAAFLAAGKIGDFRVPWRQPQRIGRDLEQVLDVGAAGREDGFVFGLFGGELVEVGIRLRIRRINFFQLLLRLQDFAQAAFDRLAHILLGIKLRFLRQVADAQVRHRGRFAFDLLVLPRHDLQQAGLAGTVQAEHADLGAGEERQRDVLEDLTLRRDDFANPLHRVNVLSHVLDRLSAGRAELCCKNRPAAFPSAAFASRRKANAPAPLKSVVRPADSQSRPAARSFRD